jgi:RNA polymerase sigma-70 factor, ECF subfamily
MMETKPQGQFVELFLANQHRVYRFIASVAPRWVETEELFQQTCLTLWEKWDQFDPQQDFAHWASGIAMNHLRNYVRKKQNRQIVFQDEVLEQLAADHIEHQPLLDDLQSALAICLEKLSAEQRRILMRCYDDESSLKTVAEAEGRTPNSLYKTLRKIRVLLYDCVTQTAAGVQIS